MMHPKKRISRREFFKLAGMTGSVLVLGAYYPLGAATPLVVGAKEEELGFELNSYIFIDANGKISIANPRPEIGQGVYQSIPMLVAEELEVSMDSINIVQFGRDQKRFGRLQGIGGSNSIRSSWLPLRKLGASARELLIDAAAQKGSVPRNECYARLGEVIHRASGKKWAYHELVSEAVQLKPQADPILKKPVDFQLLGKPLIRKDIPLKVNGTAKFGIDLHVDGMKYASVIYCPRINGAIKSVDTSRALSIPGVYKVVPTQIKVYRFYRLGVAVIADSFWAAQQGRKAVEVNWDFSNTEEFTHQSVMDQFYSAAKQSGKTLFEVGDVNRTITNDQYKIVSGEYECPYQAHATMEPMNCIVSFMEDRCEFWGGTQSPSGVQNLLADLFKISKEKITVNVPFIGGGFGRRGSDDFVYQAAVLSKELRVPIKLVWTREDDMLLSQFRPATLNKMRAVMHNNDLVGLENKMVIQDLDLQEEDADENAVADWIFDGAEQPYTIPNIKREVVLQRLPIPVGYWRSVYASTNTFCMESFVDELAHATGVNPLDYRMKMLSGSPRMIEVLKIASEKSSWNFHWKKRNGIGMAIANIFGSICCHVVKVSRKKNKAIRIDKVMTVFDCGLTVNPDTIRAQIEGSIIMGLGAATIHQIHFLNGELVERNFDTYKMPRIGDAPPIEIHLVQSESDPGGVGEPALPPIAPALANAIFHLTGIRHRKLPIDLANS